MPDFDAAPGSLLSAVEGGTSSSSGGGVSGSGNPVLGSTTAVMSFKHLV